MARRARGGGSGVPVTVGPGGRVLALSSAWAEDGAERRRRARLEQRCVECGRALPSRRTPYCSQMCQYQFHGHYFWDAARIYVKRRDRYTCQGCGERRRSRDLEVDHILEIAQGGAALEYRNLQTMCRECHAAKTRAFRATRRPPAATPSAAGF